MIGCGALAPETARVSILRSQGYGCIPHPFFVRIWRNIGACFDNKHQNTLVYTRDRAFIRSDVTRNTEYGFLVLTNPSVIKGARCSNKQKPFLEVRKYFIKEVLEHVKSHISVLSTKIWLP